MGKGNARKRHSNRNWGRWPIQSNRSSRIISKDQEESTTKPRVATCRAGQDQNRTRPASGGDHLGTGSTIHHSSFTNPHCPPPDNGPRPNEERTNERTNEKKTYTRRRAGMALYATTSLLHSACANAGREWEFPGWAVCGLGGLCQGCFMVVRQKRGWRGATKKHQPSPPRTFSRLVYHYFCM